MRNFLLAVMGAVALLGAGAGGVAGQAIVPEDHERWVLVKNMSALKATGIYIIPVGIPCCWSRNLLQDIADTGIPPRPDGSLFAKTSPSAKASPSAKTSKKKLQENARETQENVKLINFDDESGECLYDVRVTTIFPGWEWVFANVDVCAKTDTKRQEIKRQEIVLGGVPPAIRTWVFVQNKSEYDARQIFVIPTDAECCWSRNLLGRTHEKIAKGSKIAITLDAVLPDDSKNSGCFFDIRVTSDRIGTDWYLKNVDVCKAFTINLYPKKEELGGKRRIVTIENASQIDAFSAYAFPQSPAGKDLKCCWSGDLLGLDIIRAGKSLSVDFADALTPEDRGACKFKFRITKIDRTEDWSGTVDACSDMAETKNPIIRLDNNKAATMAPQ